MVEYAGVATNSSCRQYASWRSGCLPRENKSTDHDERDRTKIVAGLVVWYGTIIKARGACNCLSAVMMLLSIVADRETFVRVASVTDRRAVGENLKNNVPVNIGLGQFETLLR